MTTLNDLIEKYNIKLAVAEYNVQSWANNAGVTDHRWIEEKMKASVLLDICMDLRDLLDATHGK